ncbi:hypothetical protein PHAVU_001G097601 [Phaseolus vulgaris]|uniref:Uncharacterized protein n=1 Tax=Phaseolus vulgaris TaxID=3885 RepID=V7B4W0_PHAVU|nr:hypothetical protein PHAVU_008G154400g [Phaseolus vulgaris]ESW12937.1 hypothetical protein PHAVU_008G154400g [Phaseolus vulgaris]
MEVLITSDKRRLKRVRSSIVESFRGCGLFGIQIDKYELKKQFTISQYLRYAMRDSIRLQDPAAVFLQLCYSISGY